MTNRPKWQYTKPPHNVLVEVEDHDGTIRLCKAVWGDPDKGILPHWEHESGLILWEVSMFPRWREVGPEWDKKTADLSNLKEDMRKLID